MGVLGPKLIINRVAHVDPKPPELFLGVQGPVQRRGDRTDGGRKNIMVLEEH